MTGGGLCHGAAPRPGVVREGLFFCTGAAAAMQAAY